MKLLCCCTLHVVPTPAPVVPSGAAIYGRSKLLFLMWSYELQRRLHRAGIRGVDVFATHPGEVVVGGSVGATGWGCVCACVVVDAETMQRWHRESAAKEGGVMEGVCNAPQTSKRPSHILQRRCETSSGQFTQQLLPWCSQLRTSCSKAHHTFIRVAVRRPQTHTHTLGNVWWVQHLPLPVSSHPSLFSTHPCPS